MTSPAPGPPPGGEAGECFWSKPPSIPPIWRGGKPLDVGWGTDLYYSASCRSAHSEWVFRAFHCRRPCRPTWRWPHIQRLPRSASQRNYGGYSKRRSPWVGANGTRGLLAYCSDYKCNHLKTMTPAEVDKWRDSARLSDLEPRFICKGHSIASSDTNVN